MEVITSGLAATPPPVTPVPQAVELGIKYTRPTTKQEGPNRPEFPEGFMASPLPKVGKDAKASPQQEVAFANAITALFDKKISFNYDERIDRVVVKVMRDSTEEVIRQIPPEEMIELIAKFREDLRGLIFNRQG